MIYISPVNLHIYALLFHKSSWSQVRKLSFKAQGRCSQAPVMEPETPQEQKVVWDFSFLLQTKFNGQCFFLS